MNRLNEYGLNEHFLTQAKLYPNFEICRVVSQYKDLYKVMTNEDELLAEISGRFRFNVKNLCDYPAVGDFVMIDRSNGQSGNAIIHHILNRKSSFKRTAVGVKNQTQVVASNIDTIFICMSLNNDFNLRRLERYLSIAWDSNAIPVVLLTKSDLCEDIPQKLNEISNVAIGVDVIVTSGLNESSLEQLSPYLKYGTTSSFIGSSGVGKSTLINLLIGKELFSTNDIGKDDKGRHTTTRRELILLSRGGVVIDTPGMREVGVDSTDLSKTFSDIDDFAEQCKFKDCSHNAEPGCAVRLAIKDGKLSEERLESYFKLKKETRYDGLNSKQIEREKINSMFGGLGEMKNAKKLVKNKNKT